MRRKKAFPSLRIVASTPEPRNPQLAREAVASLERTRGLLLAGGHTESARLLDLVLLQLRLQLRGVSDAEFKALCTVMAR